MAQINEQDIRKLTEEALKQLGPSATPEAVEKVVKDAVSRIYEQGSESTAQKPPKPTTPGPAGKNRIIVTAFGKNRSGILAGLTTVLAKNNCDILDLSQKILQEFFTIMILVDISASGSDLETVKNEMIAAGEKLDLKVIVQHEDIFNAMHRV